jgi:hypothetical protein
LLTWITDLTGVSIPTVAVCGARGHVAPATAFCDAYFGRTPVAIWKASRGFGGKTMLLGLLAWAEALTLQADVVILGGSAEQSARVLEALRRVSSRPHPLQDLVGLPGRVQTRFAWGNTVRALPASQRAVRGPHPQRLRVDEIDEMDGALLDAAQGQPMNRHGVVAQTVLSSTHQYPDGTMAAMLKRAAEHGWGVYEWCYRETLQEHGGWLTSDQVERKRQELPAHMWAAEIEGQEPSAEGRAFDSAAVERMFTRELGVATAPDLARGWHAEHRDPKGEPMIMASYATGADWASERDWTSCATLRCDERPLRLVAAWHVQRRLWKHIVAGVRERVDRYPGPLAHDRTSMGGQIIAQELDPRTREAATGYVRTPAGQFQLFNFKMNGQARTDLFANYIVAVERGEIICPRLEPYYSEHKFCTLHDLFHGGHPPDSVVAMALAYYAWRHGRARGDLGIS